MKKNGKRMSNFKFRCIIIPIVVFLTAFAIAGTLVSDYFAASLDNYLGRGKIVYDGHATGFTAADTVYYDQPFERSDKGKLDASHAGYRVAEMLSDEGEVLLKNNGVLPLAEKTKVTPMGFRYTSPVMTGTGSGAATLLQDFVVRPRDALGKYFDVNKTVEDKLFNADPVYATAKGYKGKADSNGQFSGATSSVGEFEPSKLYRAADIGEYKTAIVFIGRQGGEGNDLQMTPYYDKSEKIADHQLQLMPYEKETIAFAKLTCDNVVVIVNSPNPIELGELHDDDGIDAMLWVGTTGCRGFESMAKILCGKVNPSGALVDTYYRNFAADPTFVNYGAFYYTNDADFSHRNEEGSAKAHFVEYEEGIYLGYKYYETRYGNDEAEYARQMVYPFGYGLHYDDEKISQTLSDVVLEDGTVTVTGKITNGSARDVKEIVQIYYDPPYYKDGSAIEKASKNLVAFDKIEVAANAEKDFTISFAAEDMASYDYKGYYTDGKGSYVLEKGAYGIHLADNAHVSFGHKTVTLDKTTVYADGTDGGDTVYVGKRASDAVTASNLYDYVSDYMDGEGEFGSEGACDNLTRADGFEHGTTAPQNKKAAAAIVEQFKRSTDGTFDYDKYIEDEYGTNAPTSGAKNGLVLSELRGLDYDDPLWEQLLDQLEYSGEGLKQLNKLLGNGSFNTAKVDAIGKGTTSDSDGPQAIGKTGVSDGTGAACAYPAEVVIAATWNKELAEAMGSAIGDEALAQGSNGWYAPACNIHRSPFLGRVYEYYSEDAALSGYMAMYVVQGAAKKGYTAYIKHFAVNDQELGRVALMTWANEQALREIYFKPFEIAVKYGRVTEKYIACTDRETGTYEVRTKERRAATAMMTSMNYIGAVWTTLDRKLNTDLLRGEWGFEGAVITDSATPEKKQLLNAAQAGNDFFLTFMSSSVHDSSSPVAQWTIRQAVHNIAYSVVNGNAMQNVGPGQSFHFAMSPWKIGIVVMDVVIGLLVAGGIAWIVARTVFEKKNPDKYNRRGKKSV